MKYKGTKLEGAAEDTFVIPRSTGNIVFKVRAILDYEDHEKLDPKPIPPTKLLPGGRQQVDVENTTYKKQLNDWAVRRVQYMILKTLSATEDLEWETVDLSDPATWENYIEELKNAGFTDPEQTYIINRVMQINGVDEKKIEAATKDFLAGPALELNEP